VRDVYNFPDNLSAVNISFGCETRETGEIYRQAADGILGMGNNNNALHSQLAASGIIDPTFSLCFGYPNGGGMFLGAVPKHYNLSMTYSPLLTNLPWHYYNVKVTGVAVSGKALPIDMALFDQGYGSVMDSGTTFTYLPTAVFKAFAGAVEAAVLKKGLKRTAGLDPQYDDICWKNAPTSFEALRSVFPTATLELQGGVVLELLPHRYLFMAAVGEYCLGMFDNKDHGTLIGSITVRNMLVEYDKGQGRVGFAEMDCHELGNRAQSTFAAASLHHQQPGQEQQGGGGSNGAVDLSMDVDAASMRGSGSGMSDKTRWQRKMLVLLAGAVMAGVLLELAYSYKDTIAGRLSSCWGGGGGSGFRKNYGKPSDDMEAVALTSVVADMRGSSSSMHMSPSPQRGPSPTQPKPGSPSKAAGGSTGNSNSSLKTVGSGNSGGLKATLAGTSRESLSSRSLS
jgi:hypothetical protein